MQDREEEKRTEKKNNKSISQEVIWPCPEPKDLSIHIRNEKLFPLHRETTLVGHLKNTS